MLTSRLSRTARSERRMEERTTWIFGSPRSGSTWLYLMLADHEAVVPINEPLIGQYLGPFLCDQPGTDPAGFDAGNFTVRRVQATKASQFFAEEFADVWVPALGDLLRKRLHAHAVRRPAEAAASRTSIVVKEPNGSQSADIIMRAQPQARLLFLLRDGRDVVDSDLAAAGPGSWVTSQFEGFTGITGEARVRFVVQSAHKWLWRTEIVQEAFDRHPGPKHLVRYEDLLREPEPLLREIFDWMDLPVSNEWLAELIQRHAFEQVPEAERGADKFWRSATPGGWRENMDEAEREAMTAVLGPKLRELGYEV
jgi:hypothetical protein